MTEKFSLNYFISTKQQITPEIAPKITKALLTPYSFSSKVAQKVSIWYQNLSQNEKKYLYQIPQFKSALSEKSQITSQHTIHPLWLKEIMQPLPYQFSEQWIRKLANSFCFPTIKLPSGVEISIDSEVFFKTLIWGIKNHPHLIDELNTLIRYNKKPVCVCPENGDATFDLCLGYFDWKKHSLYSHGRNAVVF